MLRAAVALTVAALLTTACETGSGVRADQISVGDCYDDPAGQEVARFDVVPCDQAHDNEVFFVFDAPSGRYPGQETLTDIATSRCRGRAFSDYVGVVIEESELRVFEVLPTKDTWVHDGDREVVCVLYAPGGRPIKGSARQAA